MTQAEYGVILSILIIVLAFTGYHRFGPFRLEMRRIQRYRLFALRDKLILLVAEGKIKEEDSVFQFLYTGLNKIIPHAKPLSLRRFVGAIRASALVEEKEFEKDILGAINHKDPAVREVAAELFNTLADILITQSFSVRVSVAVGLAGYKFTTRLRRALSHLFRTEGEAYELYKTVRTRTRELEDRTRDLACTQPL